MLTILSCALLVDIAHAQNASCTPNTVTVSNSSPRAGDSVTLYTVTQNTTAAPAEHAVSFVIDNAVVGSERVQLQPNEPQVVSVAWTATPGEHTAGARTEIPSSTGTTTHTTNSITFTVASPPPPSEAQQAAANVASVVQQGAAAAAPTILGASNAVFKVTEKIRADAIAAVEKQLAKEKAGEVLGASDSNFAAAGKVGSLLGNIWDKLLRAGLFALRIKILFYGLLAVVAYILLRLVLTWFSERRRSSFARG